MACKDYFFAREKTQNAELGDEYINAQHGRVCLLWDEVCGVRDDKGKADILLKSSVRVVLEQSFDQFIIGWMEWMEWKHSNEQM